MWRGTAFVDELLRMASVEWGGTLPREAWMLWMDFRPLCRARKSEMVGPHHGREAGSRRRKNDFPADAFGDLDGELGFSSPSPLAVPVPPSPPLFIQVPLSAPLSV